MDEGRLLREKKMGKTGTPKEYIEKLIRMEGLEEEAKSCGFIKRRRKLEFKPFLMTIIFSFGTLASLRRRYSELVENTLSRSAWGERFHRGLGVLIAKIAGQLRKRSCDNLPTYKGILSSFKDVIAVDSTTIRLHPILRKIFKGTQGGAAIKVHTRIRALTAELLWMMISSAAFGDCRAFGVDWKDTGKLFLFDMAYSSPDLWYRVTRVRAFFITRLPKRRKLVITSINRRHSGHVRGLIGKELYQEIKHLKRQFIDVMCSCRVHIRGYGGKRGRYEYRNFRIVGIWNVEKRRYHLYVTNIPSKVMEASLIGKLYRLRWEVETSYRLGKGILGLDAIRSLKSEVCVRIFVHCALIRYHVTMQARCVAQQKISADHRLNPEMWAKVFQERMAARLVFEMLQLIRLVTSWENLLQLARDPNLKRTPLRDAFPFDFNPLTSIN